MSVEDVVNLVGHIDGFSQRMIDEYGQRLMDNNINGAVLMSCDLTELKPVLQMAFGDWVLFRSLIESLRYEEQNVEPSDRDVSPPMEAFVRPTTGDVSKIRAKNTSAALKVGAVDSGTSSSKKATASDVTVASVSNSEAVSAGLSQSSPTLKDPPPAHVQDPLTSGDHHDVTDDVVPPAASMPKVMSRQDSFVNEVLMESETLREFILASMVGSDSEGGSSDSDDEVQRRISTIPEESLAVSRNTSGSSLGRQMLAARRMSVDSGPIDRAFSVGPDHDSGESDSDLERISRKSSIRQASAAHGGVVGAKPDSDAASTAEDKRKRFVAKSTKQPHESQPRNSTRHVDMSKSASKLDRSSHESSVPLMSLYFPMACDRSQGMGTSQSSGHVSPKANRPIVSQESVPGGSGHHSDSSLPPDQVVQADSRSAAVNRSSSWKLETSSSGPHPQPTSAAANQTPRLDLANRVTPPPPTSLPPESAEADGMSDSVKFFIVDESESSPKAIMLEMDCLPHRISSSHTTDPSSHCDYPDNVQV